MAVYELLQSQMIILTCVFGILAAVCGFMIEKYGKLKSKAEKQEEVIRVREAKWTDDHPGVMDFRISCYEGNNDLGFLYGTLHTKTIKGGDGLGNVSSNIHAREAGIYLAEGTYELEFESREYKSSPQKIVVTAEDIGQRKWYTFQMKKKDTTSENVLPK